MLSFIVAFGLAKSLTNLGAGALAERIGRRRSLLAGWAAALPVPLLIAIAPSWAWIVAANVFLGVNQGLAWSMTVVMKIDLVGPERRGFALGLNEAAGYGGVALAAAASGWLAAEFVARDVLVVAGFALAGRAGSRCSSSATPPDMSRSSSAATIDALTRQHPVAYLLPGRHLARPAAVVFTGRTGEQPQRRLGLGTDPAVPRRRGGEHRSDRPGRRSLPSGLGGSDRSTPATSLTGWAESR